MQPTGEADEAWYDDEAGPVVRPYAVTGGRSAPDRGRFDLITLIVTRGVVPATTQLFPEQAAIVEKCRRPLSVAEIGAELDLPVGTVRVLLGDLLAAGLIETHEPPTLSELPSEDLLRELLAGLRAL
ncbi:DUF742 domain-containing protein [Micromonospora krabiensis]|uniref:DUF742 domain-containing protein n=1 Tax=Micromonospora krabiensis TaxID=307121 RepID=A0A1C3N6I0_9ACTN|nr:DUF742 domain-containing protein [Micromonospora krabiensis]SBV28187.1 Protein of unknown function [Micromonospora krabiensis]